MFKLFLCFFFLALGGISPILFLKILFWFFVAAIVMGLLEGMKLETDQVKKNPSP